MAIIPVGFLPDLFTKAKSVVPLFQVYGTGQG